MVNNTRLDFPVGCKIMFIIKITKLNSLYSGMHSAIKQSSRRAFRKHEIFNL